MSFSAYIDNKKKDILVLGWDPTQGLKHALTAEKMYSINFTEKNKKFCLSLHYNGANSFLLVNGTEIYKFKAKDSEIVTTQSCLGNISKGWFIENMKKMSRTNEKRHIKWHETCKCKCRLDASVRNNKQRWNNDKC